MSILVLGGAGYIGSHTARRLQEAGFSCVIYDNLSRGHRAAVGDFPFYEGDLRDMKSLSRVFEEQRIEAVVHFAADSIVPESVRNPLLYYDNNVGSAICLLKVMQKYGVNKIVFSSTAAVYGEPEQVPITEECKTAPKNTYGHTKLAIENMLACCEEGWGLKYVALRYFNAAGAMPGGEMGEDHAPETHLIPLVLNTALGKRDHIDLYGTDYDTRDGTCVRDYIHILDLADAHVLALRRLLGGGESGIFNLGNGKGYSVKEVVQCAEAVCGRTINKQLCERRAGDPATLIASSEKAKKELGWQPKFGTLQSILETAWEWHKSHPDGYGDE